MTALQIVCCWISGVACGISFWNMRERNERRYADLRKQFGLPPEQRQ